MGRPKGSKNKKTIEKLLKKSKEGMIIIDAEQPKKTSIRKQVKQYLIDNGELSMDKAIELGWYRIQQYICEFRRQGMPIKSVKRGLHITYVLENTKAKADKKVIESKPVIDTGDKEFDKIAEDCYKTIETLKNATEIKSIKTSQKQTILDHLLEFGTITSIEAMKKYNCLSLPPIIKALREDGYNISTTKDRCYKSMNTKVDRVQSCSIYMLESTKKTVKKYRVNLYMDWAYDFIAPSYRIEYDSEADARMGVDTLANLIINRLNFIDSSDYTSYTSQRFADDEKDKIGVDIFKYKTTKKFFKTKTDKTYIATITVTEELVEV